MKISSYLKRWFPLFALPTTLAFILAFVVPFVLGFWLSFNQFTTVTDGKWVGLRNYQQAFQPDINGSPSVLRALLFSTLLTVVSVIMVNVFAFALASILTKAIKGRNIFRAIYFLPNLIGGIVLGYVWQVLLNALLINTIGKPLTFSPAYGFWGLVLLVNWQMIGYMMVIYIAGIQNIPGDVIEAAEIDGAGYWRRLFRVTIPMLMPSITICTFLTLSNCFKLFDQNLALTPGPRTQGLALDIFNTFYNQNLSGVGQAKAVMFFLLVALIAFIQLRATRSKEADG
ncbi:MAG: sugar ABC transporter permease [Micrococcales bacterium]|nr:sugar ABC transporter permease [Micrococcales bacterium]